MIKDEIRSCSRPEVQDGQFPKGYLWGWSLFASALLVVWWGRWNDAEPMMMSWRNHNDDNDDSGNNGINNNNRRTIRTKEMMWNELENEYIKCGCFGRLVSGTGGNEHWAPLTLVLYLGPSGAHFTLSPAYSSSKYSRKKNGNFVTMNYTNRWPLAIFENLLDVTLVV